MTTQTVKSKSNSSMNADKSMFTISVVADILQIHQRTLRIYDDEKILVPSRSPKNRRLYSINDIEKGKFVQFLTRELGINLAGIKIIFSLLDQQKIDQSNYMDHVKEIAKKLNITQEIREENKAKLSKRGRKPGKEKK